MLIKYIVEQLDFYKVCTKYAILPLPAIRVSEFHNKLVPLGKNPNNI